jgi:membrane-associated phospholipid phosphatase
MSSRSLTVTLNATAEPYSLMLNAAATWITDFGDSAVLLPIAAAVLVILLVSHSRRSAISWAVAVGLCLATMVMLKLAMHACGRVVVPSGAITSPSGHAALSVMVYGGLAALAIMTLQRASYRILIGLAASIVIGAIAVSRVILLAHSVAEVVLGLIVGAVCVAVFVIGRRGVHLANFPLRHVAPVVLVLLIFLHGHRANAESLLISLAQVFRVSTGACG